MNKKKRLGDIPQYKMNKQPSVEQRGMLQSKLSATAVKDTKYNEVTLACLNKFHPDDPRDAENFFENEDDKEIANYNVEGYKYREFRHAINLIREAGFDPNKSVGRGKKNCLIRRLSIQDSKMTGNTPTYFDRQNTQVDIIKEKQGFLDIIKGLGSYKTKEQEAEQSCDSQDPLVMLNGKEFIYD